MDQQQNGLSENNNNDKVSLIMKFRRRLINTKEWSAERVSQSYRAAIFPIRFDCSTFSCVAFLFRGSLSLNGHQTITSRSKLDSVKCCNCKNCVTFHSIKESPRSSPDFNLFMTMISFCRLVNSPQNVSRCVCVRVSCRISFLYHSHIVYFSSVMESPTQQRNTHGVSFDSRVCLR